MDVYTTHNNNTEQLRRLQEELERSQRRALAAKEAEDRVAAQNAAAARRVAERRASGLNAVAAANVVRLRSELGLTQAELARRMGKPRLVVSGIESGTRLVSLNDLPQLCFALQCSLGDLLAGSATADIDEENMELGQARSLMLRESPNVTLDGLLRRIIRDEVGRVSR